MTPDRAEPTRPDGPEPTRPDGPEPTRPEPVEGRSSTDSDRRPDRPAIAVIGIHGHGASHVRNAIGQGRLVAVIDPRPPVEGSEAASAGTPWYPSLDEFLATGVAVDVAVLCTPLPTHASMTTTLLRAGADVLLEKPPTTTMAEFTELLAVEAETGRIVQVGFQSLGSDALAAVAGIVARGEIGELSHIGVAGTWVRATSYFRRAAWAGKRVLDGRPVVDGVTTNPLAHATATALRLAGARRVEDVVDIDLELYRANDIEADDTTSLVLRSTTGPTIAGALTLCAPVNTDPWVAVYGSRGVVRLYYTRDVVGVGDRRNGAYADHVRTSRPPRQPAGASGRWDALAQSAGRQRRVHGGDGGGPTGRRIPRRFLRSSSAGSPSRVPSHRTCTRW